MATVPLRPCREQTAEPLQTGAKRSELAHSTCRAWDHNVPKGNVFHFASQRALPVCGDSDKAVIAPQCRLDAFYTAIAGSTETWSRESIQPRKPSLSKGGEIAP